MDEAGKIQRLFELGHFFNPQFPNGLNVTPKDLPKLTFKDQIVKDALLSFQEMMGVPSILVGDSGPLSNVDLFDVPRCGVADYAHPEELKGKVGTGSWPEPCQKAGVTYRVDKSNMPSKFKDTFDEKIMARVVATYGKVGLRLVPFTGTGKPNIDCDWRFLAGSTIGLTYYNNGHCSDVCPSYLDSSFAPNEAAMCDLITHEWGHACNLNHTRGGIMNPSLGSVSEPWQGWTPSDPSWNTLVRFFGGEPVDPLPNPNPNPDPTPVTLPVVVVPGTMKVASLKLDFNKGELTVKELSGKETVYVVINNNII
jgi:hypothetical protein